MEDDGFPSDADVRASATASERRERRPRMIDDDETAQRRLTDGRRAGGCFFARVGRGAGVGDGLARISSEVIGE